MPRRRRRWESAFREVSAEDVTIRAGTMIVAPSLHGRRGSAADRLLSVDEVLAATGFRARSTLWRKEREGAFPGRVRRGERTIGWRASEVQAWIAARPRKAPPS